jgi:hypothetical protein
LALTLNECDSQKQLQLFEKCIGEAYHPGDNQLLRHAAGPMGLFGLKGRLAVAANDYDEFSVQAQN